MVIVVENELLELPDDMKIPSDDPFDGLFSSKMRSRMVEEIISDPYHTYRPKELADLLDTTYPTLRTHFLNLVDTRLLIKEDKDPARPKYKVNFNSKRLIALSLLMDAINDDRDGTDTMDRAIMNYCSQHLSRRYNDVIGKVTLISIKADNVNNITINGPDENYPVTLSEGSA